MNINTLTLSNQLESLTGEQHALQPVDLNELNNVALYLRHSFKLYRTQLLDHHVVLAIPLGDIDLSPGRISHYLNVLGRALDAPVVLVLDTILSYNRQRYVQRRIPFIVPGEQLFIPKFLINLKSKSEQLPIRRSHYAPATQCMLFHHLLIHSLNGMNQKSIAPVIRYSEMTVSRAVSELTKSEILTSGTYGVEFIDDRVEIWNKARPRLISPVKTTLFAQKVNDAATVKISGLSGLSHYTNLADTGRLTYAVANESYRHLIDKVIKNVNHIDGPIKIELWQYYPKFLTKTKYADPLSIYMSLIDQTNDERVEIALDEMLNQFI